MNPYHTRPAIVDLAGDVAGRRILDARHSHSVPLPGNRVAEIVLRLK
jgi:hypothetical protein